MTTTSLFGWLFNQLVWIKPMLGLIGVIALVDGLLNRSRRMRGILTEEEQAAYRRGVDHAVRLVNTLDLPVRVWVESEDPLELGVGERMTRD